VCSHKIRILTSWYSELPINISKASTAKYASTKQSTNGGGI
jgi:hypothetical protein